MLVKDLKKLLKDLPDDNEVVVPIEKPVSVGYSPCVKITGAYSGFDWDYKRLFLVPDKRLETIPNERKGTYESEIKYQQKDDVVSQQFEKHKQELIELLVQSDNKNLSKKQIIEMLEILKTTQ